VAEAVNVEVAADPWHSVAGPDVILREVGVPGVEIVTVTGTRELT
jgi:hypothetical protein